MRTALLAVLGSVLTGAAALGQPPPPSFLLPSPAAAPGPSATAPGGFQLTRRAGGGYQYDGERFRATIHADGRVSFADRRAQSSLHVLPPIPANPVISQQQLAYLRWRHRQAIEGAGAKSPVLRLLEPPPPAKLKSVFHSLPNAETCLLPDGTNVCLTCEGGVAGGAIYALPEMLAVIWDDEARPVLERRRVLFELWLESSDPAARATILAFIRRHLAAGSPGAFPPGELDHLRRRPGAAGFAP
jgi:hypothetical protein